MLRTAILSLIISIALTTPCLSESFKVTGTKSTYIDSSQAIAHNKIIIVDRCTLITGSFNFTKTADEKNAENLFTPKGDKSLVDVYNKNFEEHKGHSEGYKC